MKKMFIDIINVYIEVINVLKTNLKIIYRNKT